MQKVLSSDLWKAVRAQARKAQCRKVAIAYVTQDLVGFRKGDTLVVDASRHAISSGETAAKLLRTLNKKGVCIYHCFGLHAKVLLLDDVAVISSGNMSKSSVNGLVEAGVMTDHSSTVAGVASLIEQLCAQSKELTDKNIDALCKIKVVRRGGIWVGGKKKKPQVTRLGNQTWLVGVKEILEDPVPDEQRMIEKAVETLSSRYRIQDEDPNWLRWSIKGRFSRECREGDSLIQIWVSSTAKRPSAVLRTAPVLLKQKASKWTRFYLKEATGKYAEMSWGKFQRLLKEVGYSRRVGAGSVQLLKPEIADAISKRWKTAAK